MNEYINKKNRNICIFTYIGLIMILVSLLMKTFVIYTELGNIILLIGLIFIIGSAVKFLLFKNKDIANRYEIAETDERQVILREKSAYYTFIFSIMLLAIVSVIFDVLGYTQQLYYIIFILISQYILYIALNFYFDRKY